MPLGTLQYLHSGPSYQLACIHLPTTLWVETYLLPRIYPLPRTVFQTASCIFLESVYRAPDKLPLWATAALDPPAHEAGLPEGRGVGHGRAPGVVLVAHARHRAHEQRAERAVPGGGAGHERRAAVLVLRRRARPRGFLISMVPRAR